MRLLTLLVLACGLTACDLEPLPPGSGGGGRVVTLSPPAAVAMPMPSRRPLVTPLAEAPPPASLPDERAASPLNGTSRGDAALERPVSPASAIDVPPGALAPGAKPRPPARRLALDLRLPRRMAAIGSAVILPVEAELSNRGNDAVALTAPTPCSVARWRLLDSAGRLVADKPEAICVQMIAESQLRPGEILVTRERIDLPPGALARRGVYHLDYAFWGVEARALITVE